jgi:hypothetical protein
LAASRDCLPTVSVDDARLAPKRLARQLGSA